MTAAIATPAADLPARINAAHAAIVAERRGADHA
jgi:hypothetical protein